MPSTDVTGRAARDRALVERQLGACRAAIAPPATPEQTAGLAFGRGDQVIHTATGQTGVVLRGERRATIAHTSRPFDV